MKCDSCGEAWGVDGLDPIMKELAGCPACSPEEYRAVGREGE